MAAESETVPSDVLAALGRLNAFARMPSAGRVRKAIYDYKSLAAYRLAKSGSARVRLVQWTGRCNRCTDGWFTHWDWDDGHKVLCRDCGGTGRRTLRFCETALPDGQIWHHPWFQRGSDIARAGLHGLQSTDSVDGAWGYLDGSGQRIPWHDAGEWAPNLPGGELELDELVPLLNIVEQWVEQDVERSCNWIAKAAADNLCQRKHKRVSGAPSHAYALRLGRAPGGCFVCGDAEDLAGYCYGRMTPLLEWSLPVCRLHGEGSEKVPHPKDPAPAALITTPVREWLDRHERIVEVEW